LTVTHGFRIGQFQRLTISIALTQEYRRCLILQSSG
jgi:hypothetical protein